MHIFARNFRFCLTFGQDVYKSERIFLLLISKDFEDLSKSARQPKDLNKYQILTYKHDIYQIKNQSKNISHFQFDLKIERESKIYDILGVNL